MTKPPPFIYGAQYYRAPTPEPSCWEYDLRRMTELGFNHVKFWAQWRWAHRTVDEFYFDDLDRLMDLAADNGLAVTINTLFDVAPSWVLKAYPDSLPITADGQPVLPRALSFRQIGGFPGPCLNHPEAALARQAFLEATVRRYADHPAMSMWDVWNEPEQNFVNRSPVSDKLSCFCRHCLAGFRAEMQRKYSSLEALNQAWGRCYIDWEEVEAPRTSETIKDFIDFRRYQLHVMETEAQARLDCVRRHDKAHPAYLHVVPNTLRIFNSLTGVDDFAMAEKCDLFASTSNGGAIWPNQLISAARGKLCYNVESHINAGQISLHQRPLELNDILADLLPQVGAGVKGFLFWQYRPEVLGTEAPAWGIVKPDGSDRAVTRAVRTFGEKLAPHMETLMRTTPEPAQVAIWKSTRNELFEYAARNDLSRLADHIEGYRHWFREHNVATINIDDSLLIQTALEGIRLLVMPACYCLSAEEADALNHWVHAGGTLLCEAHLGAWNETTGRHERAVPGNGLAEKWELHEVDSSAAVHLGGSAGIGGVGNLNPDVIKALKESGKSKGAKALGGETASASGVHLEASGYYPIELGNGELLAGADTFAELCNGTWDAIGKFGEKTVIAARSMGRGHVFYSGANLGAGLKDSPEGADAFLHQILDQARVSPSAVVEADPGIEFDVLYKDTSPTFIVIHNTGSQSARASLKTNGSWRGLFSTKALSSGQALELAPGDVDLFHQESATS